MVTQGGQLRRDDLLLDLGAGGHLPAVTALSSSSDSRMSWGRSRRFVSLTQRSTATLKTAIPASAVSVAAGPVAPRRRSASVSAEASDASLISSRSRSSALAAMTVWRCRAPRGAGAGAGGFEGGGDGVYRRGGIRTPATAPTRSSWSAPAPQNSTSRWSAK